MKPPTMMLSCALLLGSWAAAQTDPFQRGAPEQTLPVMRTAGLPPAPSGAAALPATAPGTPSFGNPRTSSDGGNTRVVFDLPTGVSYTLAPTFGGLRIDVQGARIVPAVMARLGSSVSEYRAGAGQLTLVTPFPLSLTDGWRATEANIAGGTRVLILEFGATLAGGAGPTVKGRVLTTAPASPPAVQATLNTPIQTAIQASVAQPSPVAAPSGAPDLGLSSSDQTGLPPGDSIGKITVLPPAPALPGADPDKPSALMGRVPGTLTPGATLGAPRVGKNPGLTRMVLDLPPGTTYRMVPGSGGLRIELSGVGTGAINTSAQNVSPEVKAWRYDPSAGGLSVTFMTGSPTTAHSGWRAQLLPPNTGSDRSRLAVDFSPALADTTPLSRSDRMLASVPPMQVNTGTALLALATSYARPRVVIDPGHGGVDPGAVGSITEKQVTLDVGLRVRDLLQAAGVDVIMTRQTDTQLSRDKNTDLNMRAAMGAGAQMYVSIHVNAMPAANALRGYGIETWWNPNHPLSQNLATLLQNDTAEVTGAANQGLRNTRSLAVLRNSRIPAALIEIGYTSHPVDGLNLKDTNYLDRVALGIATGIRDALVTGVTASGTVLRSAGGAGR